MLSFVVQNFFSNTPIFFKTKKYNFLLILLKIPYLSKLVIYHLLYANSFQYLYIYSNKNFFKNLISSKKIFDIFLQCLSLDFGLYTNLFSKSLILHNINKLVFFLDNKIYIFKNLYKISYNVYTKLNYIKPYSFLHFSVTKKTFKTIIMFLFYLFTINYISKQNNFYFYYNFILVPCNWYLYPLYNTFYFKIYHY